MGVQRGKKSKSRPSAAVNTGSVPASSSPAIPELDKSVLDMLKSSNHNHKIDACNSIATMVRPGHFSGLASSKILNIIVSLLNDKMLPVAIAAAGCLRNICAEIGQPVGTELSNQGLMKQLLALLEHCSHALSRASPGVNVIPSDAGLYWYAAKTDAVDRLLMQLFALLAFLCDVSDASARHFTEAQVRNGGLHLAMLMGRTQIGPDSTPFSLQVAIDALHFFRSVTLGNEALNIAILGQGSILNHLINLATYVSVSPRSTDVFVELREKMKSSFSRQLARKQGAVASSFAILDYPRIPQEISALSCAILVHLMQTASEARVPGEQLERIATPVMNGLATTLMTSDVFSSFDITLQSIGAVPALIEEVRLLKEGGSLPEVPEEADFFENETSGMAEKYEDEVSEDADQKHDLPITHLNADSIQSHMKVFSQFASATKLSLDALASFLSLLPEANEEEQSKPSSAQILFRKLATEFLVSSQNSRIDTICSIASLRLVDPALFATNSAPLTSLTPERCAMAGSTLTEQNLRQLGRVFDQTRTQATTALASVMLFVPDSALDQGYIRNMFPNIARLFLSADVSLLLDPSTTTPKSHAICQITELEALTSSLLHLSMKPTYKKAADEAWAKRDQALIQHCICCPDEVVSALATLATSTSKHITSEVKANVATLLGSLGQSPGQCNSSKTILNTLLDMLLAASRAKTSEFDLDLVFEVVNAIIDMYSEDDRNVESWKEANSTQRLSLFTSIYSAAVRDFKKNIKSKRSPDNMMRLEKAEEALENLTQFVKYKKSMKL